MLNRPFLVTYATLPVSIISFLILLNSCGIFNRRFHNPKGNFEGFGLQRWSTSTGQKTVPIPRKNSKKIFWIYSIFMMTSTSMQAIVQVRDRRRCFLRFRLCAMVPIFNRKKAKASDWEEDNLCNG